MQLGNIEQQVVETEKRYPLKHHESMLDRGKTHVQPAGKTPEHEQKRGE